MKWIYLNKDFLDYLRRFESRIPLQNYGVNRFKPFFGVVYETQDFYYITQVTSPKDRHKSMREQLDFKKLINSKETLIAAVNLNYMFPVLKDNENIDWKFIQYKDVERYRLFFNTAEKNNYIALLRDELKLINNHPTIKNDAERIYKMKTSDPTHVISQRCFNYKDLELRCWNWKKAQEIEDEIEIEL